MQSPMLDMGQEHQAGSWLLVIEPVVLEVLYGVSSPGHYFQPVMTIPRLVLVCYGLGVVLDENYVFRAVASYIFFRLSYPYLLFSLVAQVRFELTLRGLEPPVLCH